MKKVSEAEKAALRLFVLTERKHLARAFVEFRAHYINAIASAASDSSEKRRATYSRQLDHITKIK